MEKDAYIISGLLGYKIVEEKEDIVSCAFPLKSINKVIAKIENKKKKYVNNQIRIEKIYKYLLEDIKKEEIKNRIKNSTYDLLEMAYEANT